MEIRSVEEMVDAIYRLAVRGAPAIGVAAAYGVLLGLQEESCEDGADFLGRARETAATLAKARPHRGQPLLGPRPDGAARPARPSPPARRPTPCSTGCSRRHAPSTPRTRTSAVAWGEVGCDLLRDGMTLLTHCNAGALATGGMGTALAPMYVAHERGLRLHVYADETRPLLQGARLTAWELQRAGIDVTLICDNAVGHGHAAGQDRRRLRRLGPHRAQRGRVQQDRHLRRGRPGPPARNSFLRRGSALHLRPRGPLRGRDSDRRAPRRRGGPRVRSAHGARRSLRLEPPPSTSPRRNLLPAS